MSATGSGPDRSRNRSPEANGSPHTLLAKFVWPNEAPVARLRAALDGGALTLVRALNADRAYAYIPLPADFGEASSLIERVHAALPAASLARLALVQDIDGASQGRPAPYRYVVETDVRAQSDADLNDWYEREHLPGLAAVPGTVRAMRFRNGDGSPRYHACYDLERAETLGSPPWLAVRATAWSDRVRPAFYNTARTMFMRV